MLTQAEAAAQIRSLTAQIAKIGTETSKTLQKVTDLEAVITAGGNVSPEVEAALADAKTQAQATDDLVPDDEVAKAKAYLSGGLELRMEETRHLAAWIGGQEALHDRVLTLDEALDAISRVTPAAIAHLAGELFQDDRLRLAVVAPGRALRGLEKHLRLAA